MPSDQFWPWWVGGLLTGAIAIGYPLATGISLGVSGLFERTIKTLRRKGPGLAARDSQAIEDALLAETIAQFGLPASTVTSTLPTSGWHEAQQHEEYRLWFLPGLLIGAVLWALSRPEPLRPATLGASFDLRFGGSMAGALVALFLGGALVGFGTRMSGGCTSSHGLSGFATGQRGSLLATPIFWGVALCVAWTFHVLGGQR